MAWKFWSAVFTLSGAVIGAGILGLPYVFSQAGFFVGLFWLLFLGGIILYGGLCLGEVVLRTKGDHQLVGYASRYLGVWGKRVMAFAVIFGMYAALVAYLVGEGQSLSLLFTGGEQYALVGGIAFWIVMTGLLHDGLRELRKVETWGMFVIMFIIMGISVWYLPSVTYSHLSVVHLPSFFVPFGVVLFALIGFTTVPSLRRELHGDERHLFKALCFGFGIPVILYALFAFVFVGVLGSDVPEVATLAFGWPVTLLGIFTMLTSYFVLSFALKDILRFDFRLHKWTVRILVSGVPLGLYVFLMFVPILGFVSLLAIGGVVSGGLTAVLLLLMHKKVLGKGNRRPEFKMYKSWWLVGLLSVVFVVGVVVELVF